MITPKVRFREAVEYNGRAEYTIEAFGLEPGPAGIAFRSSELVDEDGSFSVTLVPWDNIISFTHALFPEPEEADEPAAT